MNLCFPARFSSALRRGNFLATAALLGLVFTAPVWGQTPAPATSQIGPGSTGSINHGVTGATGDRPHKILDGALTPETRQTLQKAMNSTGDAPPAR